MNGEPQIAGLEEAVPPWHRFSLIAHIASSVAAAATGFLLLAFISGNLDSGFFLRTWNGLSEAGPAALLFGFFCLIAIFASVSLPATWIGIVIAKRFHLDRYWQFALLGLVAALVVLSVFLLFAAGSSVGGMEFVGLVPGSLKILTSVGAAFALTFKVGIYLGPICVVAALAYRAVTGCADRFACAELP